MRIGNLNKYAFVQVRHRIHRTVRIRELFEHEGRLSAVASDPRSSMDVYARSVDTVVSTAYDIFNRKLFSLPKLLILPGVIGRQPMLLVRVFPFIFLADVVKGRIAATVTDRIERFKKEAKDLETRRTKVEQFDMKNAELVSPHPPPEGFDCSAFFVRPSYRSNYLGCSSSPTFTVASFGGGGGRSFVDREMARPSSPNGGGNI